MFPGQMDVGLIPKATPFLRVGPRFLLGSLSLAPQPSEGIALVEAEKPEASLPRAPGIVAERGTRLLRSGLLPFSRAPPTPVVCT